MKQAILSLVLGLVAAAAMAGFCPNNIPIVTLPPQQVAGFSWSKVIQPMGDACVQSIEVDPTNDNAWYVGGINGLYMTKDGGATWKKPVGGNVYALLVPPSQPSLVYAGADAKLWLSRDRGNSWNVIFTFPQPIRSLLVVGGTLYVGLGWSDHINPSGVYSSNLGGGFMTLHPFGPGQTGLIVWTLSRDPLSGMIYAGTEIFDHPQPYHPPFFRSPNAVNWTNVAGNLPWHAIDSDVRPNDGYVYALTEGDGVYGSSAQGNVWQPPQASSALGTTLLMDPKVPTRLYAGRVRFNLVNGGIFRSINAGSSFQPIGLQGVTIGDIALNGATTRIYVAAYASGVYTSPVP